MESTAKQVAPGLYYCTTSLAECVHTVLQREQIHARRRCWQIWRCLPSPVHYIECCGSVDTHAPGQVFLYALAAISRLSDLPVFAAENFK